MFEKYILKVVAAGKWTKGVTNQLGIHKDRLDILEDGIKLLIELGEAVKLLEKSTDTRLKQVNGKLTGLKKKHTIPPEIIPLIAVFADKKARDYDSTDPRMSVMHDSVSTLCTYLTVAIDAHENDMNIVERLEAFTAMIEATPIQDSDDYKN